ncbi:MAG: DUF512 domain-containing protein [Christensenellaceae bacterium]|jgi:putative radical SAM enzyme (TIGR03279 family)|nr:DUF512 domain-containing protein [Christensenellaceae bacterium]
MGYVISAVRRGSLAEELGLERGDELLFINGEALIDLIDYQYLTAGEKLNLICRRGDEEIEFDCEKDDFEELGAEFEGEMLKTRLCANRCVFCFVDQLPSGCRESLYVKDDDWRLSLMMGNFVTMSNVGERELDRIITRRASPLYISVHATNPSLRAYLLGNERAGEILPTLQRLKDAGLAYHLQAVLCPGINDGEELGRTIEELYALRPAALSLALVPVGLTRSREGLPELRPFTQEESAEIIEQTEGFQARFLKESGSRFVFPADEFYCKAQKPFPPPSSYEGYPQIENGVGMFGQMSEDFEYGYGEGLRPPKGRRDLILACGKAIEGRMRAYLQAHPIQNVRVRVVGVENRFFGASVDVTGLLTGSCLREGLKNQRADELLLSSSMFRAGSHVFLDDSSAEELSKALSMPIRICQEGGDGLLEGLCGRGGEQIHGQ